MHTGHATREIEIAKHLTQVGHSVVAVSGAPAAFFKQEIKSPRWGCLGIEADKLLSVSFTYCPNAVHSPSCALCCSFSFRKAVLDSGSKQSDAFRWDCSVIKSMTLAHQQMFFGHATDGAHSQRL